MKITPKITGITGSFDTATNEMVCLASKKNGIVQLSFKENHCDFLFPFATIKLYDGNTRVKFEQTFEDAEKLGEEIARRWNSCCDKQ